MQVKYYNSGNNQWESANPLPPEEIYIGDTPPAQGINAKLWLDTSVTGLLPASYAVADNCEQTVAGQYVLDAHQGYLLQNQIDVLSNALNMSVNAKANSTITLLGGSATTVNANTLYIYTNSSNTIFKIYGRLAFSGWSRSSSNPGFQVQTILRPPVAINLGCLGIPIGRDASSINFTEVLYGTLKTDGILEVHTTETFTNFTYANSGFIFFGVLNFVNPIV